MAKLKITAIIALAFLAALVPAALADDSDAEMLGSSDMVLLADKGSDHNYLYDGILILVIVLVVLGALHVRYRGMDSLKPSLPKRRKN